MKFDKTHTLMAIAILVLGFLFLRQCGRTSNIKDDLKISKMNELALADTVSSYETKNFKLVYKKRILIADKKDLKKLNEDLYDEIKELKKKPKVIIKEAMVVETDTVEIPTEVIKYPDGTSGLCWMLDTTYSENNFQTLAGETKFKLDSSGFKNSVTFINDNKIGISFTTGLTKRKDHYEIFLKSDYPGFTVTALDGAIIDKKMIESRESSFVLGPSLGYGIVLTNGEVRYGVTLGFNVTYNLNKPIKKIFRPLGL